MRIKIRSRSLLMIVVLVMTALSSVLYACGSDNKNGTYDLSEPEQVAQASKPETVHKPEAEPSTGNPQGKENENERHRITINSGKFVVDGDKQIWINGVNTPWDNWNDFGGRYNDEWWDGHFKALRENGVNASRVWINCNNDQNAVFIDTNGMVSGVSDKHWADLDMFFATAERQKIYIMATFLSFDHFKSKQAENWRNMLMSDEAVDSYIKHYTLPFLERYKDNPYLWSIDLMNEPDWVHENEECGKLAWEDISRFFARNAAAIRENSPVLVTVGMAFPKYNADGSGYEGNKVSDVFLQKIYANENARLDFWSTHYYDWVGQWYGIPFISTPSRPRNQGGWNLEGGRPAILAEFSANGSAGSNLIDDFTGLIKNEWQGAMPWTSNGVDANGGFDEVTPATRHIAELYPELVFPLG